MSNSTNRPYPTSIINAATYVLWRVNHRVGERYLDFLRRVFVDFDVPAKCAEVEAALQEAEESPNQEGSNATR